MRKKHGWLKLIFPAALVILLLAGGLLANRAVPGLDAQLASLKPAILVNISDPVNGQEIQPGVSIGVFVSVDSAQALASVQAYVDGIPLAPVMSTSLEQSPITALFHWSPAAEGWYLLTARATDVQGFTAVSNPVRVKAVLPPSPLPMEDEAQDLPLTVFGLSSEAVDFDTELDAEIERLLVLWEGHELAPQQIPSFPAPDLEIQPEPLPADIMKSPGRASFLQKFQLWLAASSSLPRSLPPAPYLGGNVEECSLRFWINDQSEDELGFRLYRLGPLETGWVLVADLEASRGKGVFEYIDPLRSPGKHAYYAASYNRSGENPGNFLSLEVVAEACSTHSPVVVSLQNARLTPELPVDRLYCYASLDEVDWVRIPREQEEFISPVAGSFDLSQNLGALAPAGKSLDLSLECWGWQGQTLMPLGRGAAAAEESRLEFTGDQFSFSASLEEGAFDQVGLPLKLTKFAPPMNLDYADSLAGCMAYTGNDASLDWACENLIEPYNGTPIAGHNILVWLWYMEDNCSAEEEYCGYNVPKSEVAGYHVYSQTLDYEPILIRTVNRNDVTMAVLSPGEMTGDSSDTRYFVRAFQEDGYESGDSNYLQAAPAPYRMTIPALWVEYLSILVFKPGKTVGVDIEGYWQEDPLQEFNVGYMRHRSKNLPKSFSFIWDAWVDFDLAQVPGTITSASLMWDGEIVMSGPGWDKLAYWCFNQLTNNWGFLIGYSPYLLPFGDIDVTKYVMFQQQADELQLPVMGMTPGAFGFWMRSGLRTHYTTEYKMDACFEAIKNVRLEVEYYK